MDNKNKETKSITTKYEKYVPNKPNMIILGESKDGRAFHPWDNLKSCACGGNPWMAGKNNGDFYEGGPYKIKCCKCGKETKQGEIPDIKSEWNGF